jgi:hypothetical protein
LQVLWFPEFKPQAHQKEKSDSTANRGSFPPVRAVSQHTSDCYGFLWRLKKKNDWESKGFLEWRKSRIP